MEFERAIYRVYERSMEGLISEDGTTEQSQPFYKQSCRIFEYLVLSFGLVLLAILLFLHATFVGNAGCLPDALLVYNSSTNQSSLPQFSKDTIMYVTIDQEYLREKGFNHNDLLTDDNNDDTHTSSSNRRRLSSSKSHMKPTSPSVVYKEVEEERILLSSSSFSSLLNPLINLYSSSSIPQTLNKYLLLPTNPTNPLSMKLLSNSSSSNSTNNNHDNTKTNSSDSPASSDPRLAAFEQSYDYMVTFDWAVTILDNDLRAKHDFTLINVTLPGYQCFGTPFAESLLPFGGLDRAMLNNIIFTVKKNGYLWTKDGDLYHWNMKEILPYPSVIAWISFKWNILWYSGLAFFLLSTTTALLVRILISSGVIIIFPIFWLMQCAGLNALNLRILSISYPWIGLPLQIIQFRQQSVFPFLIAHFIRVVLYYLLYIAAQSVYLRWLYNGTTFIQGQLWLYAVMMLWEYFSMIYVRAENSIALFPRASLAMFLMFHFYYYSFPSGFHLLALMIMFVFLVYVMTFCIRRYEVKAFRQGLVNFDQPRMLYNSLPWPSWRAELSPEYTLFMPVNMRSRTIYQNQVPALHPTQNNETNNNTVTNNTNNNTNNPLHNNNNGTGTMQPNFQSSGSTSSIPSPAPSSPSNNNNIEMSSITPPGSINSSVSASRGSSTPASFVMVNDIENNNNRTTPNNNNQDINSAFSAQTPLNFITRFFTPANYQSISNTSSHHSNLMGSDDFDGSAMTMTNTTANNSNANTISSSDSESSLRAPLNNNNNSLSSSNPLHMGNSGAISRRNQSNNNSINNNINSSR